MPSIKAFFSPGDECLDAIISFIRSAERYLDICVYTISDNRISDELVQAYDRGVDVRVISDNEKMNDQGSDIRYISEKGVAVRIDMSTYHMHHKFAIADEGQVLTGSYNWTRTAAVNNHENIVLIEDKEVALAFSDTYISLWETCKPID